MVLCSWDTSKVKLRMRSNDINTVKMDVKEIVVALGQGIKLP